MTYFEKELESLTPSKLAKIYSKLPDCLNCPCADTCNVVGFKNVHCAMRIQDFLEQQVLEHNKCENCIHNVYVTAGKSFGCTAVAPVDDPPTFNQLCKYFEPGEPTPIRVFYATESKGE